MKKFWVRRALRIFPLFYLFILCVVLIGFFLDTNTSLKQILISAIYGFNFVPKSEYNIMLGHTWSLAVEEHFYLIWPPVLILMLKKNEIFAENIGSPYDIFHWIRTDKQSFDVRDWNWF